MKHLALFVLLIGSSSVSFGATRIWDLMQDMRVTRADERSVQALFGGQISARFENGYWRFFEGTGPTLGDGVEIARFGFMTKNDASAPPWIHMELKGTCVAYDEVKKAYPDLQSDGTAPTVHSPRAVYWSRHDGWEMEFSFTASAAMAPQCLANVGFSPKT